MNSEQTDFKAKFLKFVDKEKQWKKDMTLVVESEKAMKGKFNEMEKKLQEKEKELQDKEKELELSIIPPTTKSSEKNIVHAIS